MTSAAADERPPVGSLAWARARDGRLSRRDQLAVAAATSRDVAAFARSQLLLATGRGARTGAVELDSLQLPDSELTQAALRLATERQSAAMLNHANRTFGFGLAIAEHRQISLDLELFWCACLLHDVELEHPEPGRDFAAEGGLTAHDVLLEAGATPSDAEAIAETIVRHASPGIDPTDHPAAWAVSAGAQADIVARHRELLAPSFVDDLFRRHEDLGFGPILRDAWTAQAAACPGGRAAVIQRVALLPWMGVHWPLAKRHPR